MRRRRFQVWRWLVFALAMNCVGAAFATPIFLQGPTDGADGLPSFPGLFIETADNFAPATDFALANDAAVVTGIRWWGSFLDDSVSTPDTDLFTIRIFEDAGGLPDSGGIRFDRTFNSTEITRTATSLVDVVDAPVYQFDVTLPDLLLEGQDPFYLSVVYEFDSTDAEFYWLFSDRTGSSYYRDLIESPEFMENLDYVGNLSFAILSDEAAAVPEPGTLGMLALGIVLIMLGRFRTRWN